MSSLTAAERNSLFFDRKFRAAFLHPTGDDSDVLRALHLKRIYGFNSYAECKLEYMAVEAAIKRLLYMDTYRTPKQVLQPYIDAEGML